VQPFVDPLAGSEIDRKNSIEPSLEPAPYAVDGFYRSL
jgi:hypothetical protein